MKIFKYCSTTAAFVVGAAIFAVLPNVCPAVDRIKDDNADNLNLASSWVGGTAPGAGDVAVWDATVAANFSSLLGADLSWAGVRLADPAGTIAIQAGNTLTLGASGVDMSAATTNLSFANALNLGSSQTWNVGAGAVLTASGVVSGDGTLTKEGDGTVVMVAANTYTGGTIVNAGSVRADNNTSNFGGTASNIVMKAGTTMELDTTQTITTPMDIQGTITMDLRNQGGNQVWRGSWSGSGTVDVINQDGSSRRTFTMGGGSSTALGSWNNFTGTANFGTNTGDFRFNDGGSSPNTGNPNCTIDLGTGDGTRFFSRNRGASVYIGELRGGPTTQIKQGASSSGTANYYIGGKNTDSVFEGSFVDAGSSSSGFVKLNKVGTGTFTMISASNTYAGGTAVMEGVLQVGNGGTTGDLGLGDVSVDSLLVIDRSDDIFFANNFSGGGTVRKTNSNTLTVTGNNTMSGVTVVDQGTLAVQSATFAAALSIAPGAAADLSSLASFDATLAGEGSLSGFVSAGPGAILSPGFDAGNGYGKAGTLTFNGGLTENGSVVNRFDLSDDVTGTTKTNDVLAITGDLTFSGVNTVLVNPTDSLLAVGTYRLITFTGLLYGDVTNNIVLAGAVGYLTTNNSPNAIDLVVTYSRPATNLTWVGDNVQNDWDFATTANWNDGTAASIFFTDDNVTFNDAGSFSPAINLVNTLPAGAVLVDSTNDYVFTGSGAIYGSGGLTKTNTGTLTIQTLNGYPGPTVVGGGTLAVSSIVNGAQPSGLGASASDAGNLELHPGTTLQYDGVNTSSDRGATLIGGGINLNVSQSGVNLQLGGTLVGVNEVGLVKTGDGTLTLAAASGYRGSVTLSNGVFALGSDAANNSNGESGLGQTTNTVTFRGGTLELFGYNGSTSPNYSTVFNPLIVPAGETGTLRMFSRGPLNSGGGAGLQSSLTGEGTLNLVVNYVRDDLSGDWSSFTGLIDVTAKNGADEMRINNDFGYAGATLNLNDGVTLCRSFTADTTNDIGALTGTSLAILGPGTGSGVRSTWRVGFLNGNDTYAGTIADDGSNTVVKVGTGTWTLSGFNSAARTIVSEGVLAVSGSLSGGNVDVAAGATLDVTPLSILYLAAPTVLGGDGLVSGGVDTTGGGTIAPGFSIGTLTVNSAVNLGGTSRMEVDRNGGAFLADKLVAPSITEGGVLKVVNIGAPLQVGDTFDLFDGSLSGAFTTFDLGYYTWDTSLLASTGVITVTGTLPPPTLSVSFDGSFLTLTSTGGIPNSSLAVVTSTDAAAPLDTWSVVQVDVFDFSGNYTAYIPVDTGTPQQFYAIRAL